MSTLVAGSVTVASDESASGSGMALDIYTADIATIVLPTLPTLHSTAAPWSAAVPVSASDVAVSQTARLGLLRDSARRATAYASGIVTNLQAHGIGL